MGIGVAALWSVLLVRQSTLKSLHKIQIASERVSPGKYVIFNSNMNIFHTKTENKPLNLSNRYVKRHKDTDQVKSDTVLFKAL